MMDKSLLKNGILITQARDYCVNLENAHRFTRREFVDTMLSALPAIYAGFLGLNDTDIADDCNDYGFLPQYLTEEAYDEVRAGAARVLADEDIYLETVSVDMKYSDTPIAASISEGLTDIYQDLFNCITAIRESEGLQTNEALRTCRDNFNEYWSQTLCNVLRALNPLRNKDDND